MKKIEKDFLKKFLLRHEGLLSPVDLFNSVGEHKSEKLIHKLIATGFIEEVPHRVYERDYTFYRLTEKAHSIFYPFHQKIYFLIKGDIRTVIVSSIVAIATTLIALVLNNLFT